MIKVGIIGGAGYTAGELIRILLHHPETEIYSVVSKSHAGQLVSRAHPDLTGEIKIKFSESLKEGTDVVFLCAGHGKSRDILADLNIPGSTKIIDLSADFRLAAPKNEFVYGLPELNKTEIASAVKIANPGCFATCIQLCLLPLADAKALSDDVHITAITGSTGAGQAPTETTHFSWRSNNVSVYKPFTHQHMAEIEQSLKILSPAFQHSLHFIPMRGAFTRGILAACYIQTDYSREQALEWFSNYYDSHPFVTIAQQEVDVKQVVNTNKAMIRVQKVGSQLLITGVIDNLIKGASGQAVQNMNLMFGLEETTGLKLKPSAF